MFDIQVLASATTVAIALFVAINWALNKKIAPLNEKINMLSKDMHEVKEEQKVQSARTDHLYQISNELMATMIKGRK